VTAAERAPIVHVDIEPIGTVCGGRRDPVDDQWADVEATIDFDSGRLAPDATAGLEDFSHVEVVYVFHLVAPDDVHSGARHPRGRLDWPMVGILSQRAKARPNRIGVTVCELLSVNGLSLRVRGLDAVDGTPVVDVKPYMRAFAPRGAVREPAWVGELMREYW
jgi:tRNA-Thr(GGU) m(6)t(6)A37 methyltransferase TsaA